MDSLSNHMLSLLPVLLVGGSPAPKRKGVEPTSQWEEGYVTSVTSSLDGMCCYTVFGEDTIPHKLIP